MNYLEEQVFCGCKPNTVGHEPPCKLADPPAEETLKVVLSMLRRISRATEAPCFKGNECKCCSTVGTIEGIFITEPRIRRLMNES